MNWQYNILSFINPDSLLKIFFTNKDLFKKIAVILIQKIYSIKKEIVFNNIFTEYVGLYPRIRFMKTNHLTVKNEVVTIISDDEINILNRYIFNGLDTTHVPKEIDMGYFSYMYSDKVLPHPSNSNIPFTIGYTKENKFNLVSSNLFYFEVFIDEYNFRKPFLNERLNIGFTDVTDDPNNINFGSDSAFGIDCINAIFRYYDEDILLPIIIAKGDTIGLGLQYIERYVYKPIITFNGNLVKINKNIVIKTKDVLKVIVNLKMYTGIDINFGNKKYKFNIEELVKSNIIINSSKNNLINNGFNIKEFETDNVLRKLTTVNEEESIYNLV